MIPHILTLFSLLTSEPTLSPLVQAAFTPLRLSLEEHAERASGRHGQRWGKRTLCNEWTEKTAAGNCGERTRSNAAICLLLRFTVVMAKRTNVKV